MNSTRSRRVDDGGSVTIEAAIALSVVVIVLAMCLAGIGCAIGEIRCVDAAREAARLAARGDGDQAAEVVAKLAPAEASLNLRVAGDTVIATVTAVPVGGLLPAVRLTATAVAAKEPTANAEP
ncbi:MAG: pilus assembly protein [Actinomycetota bacterium]|nr:pilus assembly protein [Actinomycetota bacterium]